MRYGTQRQCAAPPPPPPPHTHTHTKLHLSHASELDHVPGQICIVLHPCAYIPKYMMISFRYLLWSVPKSHVCRLCSTDLQPLVYEKAITANDKQFIGLNIGKCCDCCRCRWLMCSVGFLLLMYGGTLDNWTNVRW